MHVVEAIQSRMTCRAFLGAPVSRAVVEDILEDASRAPSGGNLQPWRVWVLANDRLEQLKAKVAEKLAAGQIGEPPTEIYIYPMGPKEPYESRKFAAGEAMYAALGIDHDDHAGRFGQLHRNFEFFGAPVGLFFAIDRIMQQGQWAELGMFMQSIMLLAREKGLHTAPIGAWSLWHKTVREFLQMPEDLILYCGMGLGYRDDNAPVNQLRTERAPLGDIAIFDGFDTRLKLIEAA
jgi:nitroreductase